MPDLPAAPPSAPSPLLRALADVTGLKPHYARQLAKEGITTASEVMALLPFRHEDRNRLEGQTFHASETPGCHAVLVIKTGVKFFGQRRGGGNFEAVVQHLDANALGQQLTLRWWNMPFMSRAIAEGQELIIYGKIKDWKGRLSMDHPEYEVIKGGDDDEAVTVHSGRITPIYRLKGGLSQKAVRSAAWHVLQSLPNIFIHDLLPTPRADGEFAGWSRSRAIREVHFATSAEALELARRYLALEEFYLYQLRVVRRRREFVQSGGRALKGDGNLFDAFLSALPFQLTDAQARCLREIKIDMASHAPMNRLLHGDVGSGKTVVAFAAMLVAVEAGAQAALMAPTQILAEQHARNARKWLEPLGIRVALLTGAKKEDGSGMELFDSRGTTRVPRVDAGVSPASPEALSKQVRYSRRNLPHFERPWAKYMLTWSTIDHRQLSPQARNLVLQAILYHQPVRYTLYAACVMPDHVHMLIEPSVKERDAQNNPIFWTLTEIMHSLKSYTSHEINSAEGSTGTHWWDKETFDRLIRSESDMHEKHDYIVSNPWSSGLVEQNQDYPWTWSARDGWRDANHDTRDACGPQADQKPHLLIGTHALLHNDSLIHNLGLVVIDEQHKFGVAQRARLIQQGSTPDVLVMTATPIPRTLTLTIYGDLDVSTIDQRPQQGVKIVTAVRPKKKVDDAAKFLREQIEAGRQGYLVYPLIEESDKLDAGAATKGHTEWTKLLKPHTVGLLHGRMSAEEKDAVMKTFREGKLDALVSTTVIEVGVDVPNATVMFIHDAGRFGLAQLHQLRGRIGRGAHSSYCVLFVDEKDEEAKERLAIMEETSDGFRIAEEDLKRRGPGNVLGHAQSGQAPLRFAELLADTRLVRLARQLAERTLDEDPTLTKPEHLSLRPFAFEGHAVIKEMMQ